MASIVSYVSKYFDYPPPHFDGWWSMDLLKIRIIHHQSFIYDFYCFKVFYRVGGEETFGFLFYKATSFGDIIFKGTWMYFWLGMKLTMRISTQTAPGVGWSKLLSNPAVSDLGKTISNRVLFGPSSNLRMSIDVPASTTARSPPPCRQGDKQRAVAEASSLIELIQSIGNRGVSLIGIRLLLIFNLPPNLVNILVSSSPRRFIQTKAEEATCDGLGSALKYFIRTFTYDPPAAFQLGNHSHWFGDNTRQLKRVTVGRTDARVGGGLEREEWIIIEWELFWKFPPNRWIQFNVME